MTQSRLTRIAIVGGGLAALTLGRVLQIKGIPFTIFERDVTAANRAQGGTLDLEVTGGQLALRMANLHDAFRTHMRKEGQASKVASKDGRWLFVNVPNEDEEFRPEIDRSHLRKIFLDVLGENVKWNSQVKAVTKQVDGGYKLVFAESSSQAFDLVIGADGCFSTIAPVVFSSRPEYTGVTFFETHLDDADNKHPSEAATVGDGSIYTFCDSKGIIAQRNSDGKIRTYAALCVPATWYKEHEKAYDWDNTNGHAQHKLLEEFFGDWCPELRALIANSSGESTVWPRPIYALPVGHRWTHLPGVTVIGDAAHVMSPFAGEGANVAMLDGAKLGEAIAEGIANGGVNSLDRSIQGFEEWMFERAQISAAESDRNLKLCTGPDAAEKLAAVFQRLWERGHSKSGEKYTAANA